MAAGRTFTVSFDFGDRVHIDGDESIKATVTAFVFREAALFVECSWMHNGKAESERIEHYRLTKVT
jgi:hypothetical protein